MTTIKKPYEKHPQRGKATKEAIATIPEYECEQETNPDILKEHEKNCDFCKGIKEFSKPAQKPLDFEAFFDFLDRGWDMEYGTLLRFEEDGYSMLRLSTGGWSENESCLTEAQMKFKDEWGFSKHKWETGGHYWFRNPIKPAQSEPMQPHAGAMQPSATSSDDIVIQKQYNNDQFEKWCEQEIEVLPAYRMYRDGKPASLETKGLQDAEERTSSEIASAMPSDKPVKSEEALAPATKEEILLMETIYERFELEDEWALEQLRDFVQKEVEKVERRCDACKKWTHSIILCRHCQTEYAEQAVEKAMDEYYIRIITAFRDERKVKEVVKERIEKEKKQKGRHGAMITIAPILEYIDALYFAESCARIARFHDARADEKSEEHKPIIAAGSDSNQAKAATNPDREHSGSSSLSISEQQAVEKALAQAEDNFKCREIAAYELGLAEHTEDEKKEKRD